MVSANHISSIYQHPAMLLQRLIQFNTTNPPGNESECISYINDLLTEAGIETKIFAKSPQRPNLVARLSGQGNALPLLLYGHVDVVTTENQEWRHPPFEGKLVDDFVWGRGALDMKGGVAMMLAAFLAMKKRAATLAPSFWLRTMQVCLKVFAMQSVSLVDLLCISENGDSIPSRSLRNRYAG
jgi:acetylornithine deacetylase/succinyl-diaminopimelate desuccinylase-like protein